MVQAGAVQKKKDGGEKEEGEADQEEELAIGGEYEGGIGRVSVQEDGEEEPRRRRKKKKKWQWVAILQVIDLKIFSYVEKCDIFILGKR